MLESELGVGDVLPADALVRDESSGSERDLVLSSNLASRTPYLSVESMRLMESASNWVCKFNISSEVLSISSRWCLTNGFNLSLFLSESLMNGGICE